MDKKISLICDRCQNIIDGYVYDFEGHRVTAAFYEISGGFRMFFNAGEFVLCDLCVHSDDRYKKIYGNVY